MSYITGQTNKRSSLERALLALKDMRARLTMLEQTRNEPVAIIGIGCRFPGGVDGPQGMWQLLSAGRDAITEVPLERWNVEAYYDSRPETPGKMYTRWGGFLTHTDQFDANFFGISPREAEGMDPQHRLLLEVTWEALGYAGIVPESLAGSRTGVFVAVGSSDYARLLAQTYDLSQLDVYSGLGSATSVAAGRISYLLGLQGPSLVVDTACSSSLVALHLACQSLRNNECTMAISGGVNLILLPDSNIIHSKARMAAADGRCKTFDARADGYTRSEGCGIIILKRLSDAVANGDPILALIRGSAVNQDGHSNGLTAPNSLAQEAVIRAALERAQVKPAQISYVEAHGTGTALGDPVEMRALHAVFHDGHSVDKPLIVGSLKTNIGHTEAAAGIAGILKVVLSLLHEEIPPHLHLQTPNPYIEWENMPLRVPIQLLPWKVQQEPRLAGVSSFGVSGTNAHVILQEAPRHPLPVAGAQQDKQTYLLPLSAKTPLALEQLVQKYINWFSAGEQISLYDCCYTASVCRSHHRYRWTVSGHTSAEILARLRAYRSEKDRHLLHAVAPLKQPEQIAWVFPGQGSQWIGMGRQLFQQEPVFRTTIEACDAAMHEFMEWSLVDALHTGHQNHAHLQTIDSIQPLLFAIQVALAALWRSWGIEPGAVVGHSMGEVAAAYIAGALSLEDAVRIICLRSKLLSTIAGRGTMAMVELSLSDAQTAIQGYEHVISIAANNSARATILAGESEALEQVLAALQQKGIFCRKISVDVASHSFQVEPLLNELRQLLHGIQPRKAHTPIYSTVTGQVCSGEELTADYWVRNLKETVLFAGAIEALICKGYTLFMEISPHPTLVSAITECLLQQKVDGIALPSLRRQEDERQMLLTSLGVLYRRGQHIRWSGCYPEKATILHLPTYPWQRQRYWATMPRTFASNERNEYLPLRVLTDSTQHGGVAAPMEIGNWLYEVEWQEQQWQVPSRPAMMSHAQGTCWLIFADRAGIGQKLAEHMSTADVACLLVSSGDTYAQIDASHFIIRPNFLPDILRLIQYVEQHQQKTLLRVVYLWALDSSWDIDVPVNALEDIQERVCGTVLTLLQALARPAMSILPKIWAVTTNCQVVESEAYQPQVAQAPLWGLGTVIATEYPDCWGGMIDLDQGMSVLEAKEALVREMQSSDGEQRVALRKEKRYVARLTRKHLQDEQPLSFTLLRNASYLITGGLGDLGICIAHWLIEQGARRLILLGRTPLPARVQWSQVNQDSRQGKLIAAIQHLEALGASIHLAAVDVADEKQLADFLATFRQEGWPPIRGVVHAAGISEDRLISQLDTNSLRSVLRPKVAGGWLLHKLLLATPLDFFLTFSSMGALIGLPGQASYAAANAFLDALAHYRKHLQLPALSINWGPWTSLGLATGVGVKQQQEAFSYSGVNGFTAEQALYILHTLLRQQSAQVAAVRIDWNLFLQSSLAKKYSLLVSQLAATEPINADTLFHVASWREKILAQPSAQERSALLVDYLKTQIAQTLHLETAHIGIHDPLSNLGTDSFMALELRNRLERDLSLALPATLVWNFPTLAALTVHLGDLLGLTVQPAAMAQVSPRQSDSDLDPATVAKIWKISDEEAEQLLAQKLMLENKG